LALRNLQLVARRITTSAITHRENWKMPLPDASTGGSELRNFNRIRHFRSNQNRNANKTTNLGVGDRFSPFGNFRWSDNFERLTKHCLDLHRGILEKWRYKRAKD
jgi:hypothetical protein